VSDLLDDELKQLAALALRNAFYHDFSAMVSAYLAASSGLGVDSQEDQLGELTSIYGRDTGARGSVAVISWTSLPNKPLHNHTPHGTILHALAHDDADAVFLRGKKVFERRGDEWYFVGDRS